MREQRMERLRVRFLPSRHVTLALIVTALAGLLITLFVGRQLEIARRQRALREFGRAHAIALQEQDALRARLAQQDDDAVVEALAREKLGLVMPGEEKVIFVEEP